jgi:hypothetical protein
MCLCVFVLNFSSWAENKSVKSMMYVCNSFLRVSLLNSFSFLCLIFLFISFFSTFIYCCIEIIILYRVSADSGVEFVLFVTRMFFL